MTTAYIQLITLVLAALALLMGAYLLIIGKRPWRGGESAHVAPRVRLLGFSYILVFGAAMVQIIIQPSGIEAEALGGLMVLGGMIVIVVVYLEARASRLATHEDRLDNRLQN
ncbi:MAG TPA: hypothetical protein VGE99_02995 [Candidatus Dormibacteraeota bacterium]